MKKMILIGMCGVGILLGSGLVWNSYFSTSVVLQRIYERGHADIENYFSGHASKRSSTSCIFFIPHYSLFEYIESDDSVDKDNMTLEFNIVPLFNAHKQVRKKLTYTLTRSIEYDKDAVLSEYDRLFAEAKAELLK